MGVRNWLLGVFRRQPRHEEGHRRTRGAAIHVVILDGTMSSLEPGCETNAGLTYKLIQEASRQSNVTIHYEAGIQWSDWTETFGVIVGKGINRQIQRAYGVLCSRWRPGDKIYLIGYSRGAFAVRSLAGIIDRMGLVRQHQSTERNITLAYRYYSQGGMSPYARRFRELYCDRSPVISAIGVWDTVKSLGLRLPVIWRFEEKRHSFHSDGLVPSVRAAYQALAKDENRDAFVPEIWRSPENWAGKLEQVWFRGGHGDVGGQIGGQDAIRPLSNIPLVWLLEKLEAEGLCLPEGWKERFPQDPQAPEIGAWSGWNKFFLSRHRRVVGLDPSEKVHESAQMPPRESRRELVKRQITQRFSTWRRG